MRFAVGSQMQPGQIKSVALKGVKNAGTYNMANAWTLGDATADFSQTLDKETTGNEGNGDEITSAEGTFMMLPQILPADAMIKVVFTNASGVDRTLYRLYRRHAMDYGDYRDLQTLHHAGI